MVLKVSFQNLFLGVGFQQEPVLRALLFVIIMVVLTEQSHTDRAY